MSVLIKGVEMPRSCEECRFNDDGYCCALGIGIWEDGQARNPHPYCPLIEIPPHGRLIDADALTELVETEFRNWGEDYDASQFLGDIEDAPTIIEAERRSDG